MGDAPDGQYLTDRLTDEAERFLEAHRKEPFFLYMPHYGVHTPLKAKEALIAKYPRWDGTPHGRQENPWYAAMIESLDESVGRIVAKVEELGLTDNTLIIFTSDNGGLATIEGPNTPATINAPFREEGGISMKAACASSDRALAWPRAERGRRYAGLGGRPAFDGEGPLSASWAERGDGVSLASLWTEESRSPRVLSSGITPLQQSRGSGLEGRFEPAAGSLWKITRPDAAGSSTWDAISRSRPTSPI